MLSRKKKSCVRACIASMLLLPALAFAQSGQDLAPATSQSEIKERILFEVKRVKSPKYLDNSTASPETIGLARQLSDLARDLQIAWLKRGIDDSPPPSDMADRLSSAGFLHREKIVATLGRIATQTLTPAALPIKKSAGKHPSANLRSSGSIQRKGTGRPVEPISPEQLDEFTDSHCSMKFNFIEQHSCETPCLLTIDQISLSVRLDETTRSCLANWGKKYLSSAETAQGLPIHASRLKELLIKNTDSILFQAILRPEQIAKFERAYWASRGTAGLLEPEMRSKLGISRDQRYMIEAALNEKTQQAIAMREISLPYSDKPSLAEREQLGAEWNKVFYQQQAAADEVVWDALTPSQISKYNKILGGKALPPQRLRHIESPKRPAPSS
jgi:hypothetical protein